MKQEAINTFSEGLVMDLNPLTTPNSVLTSALNATMITYDGNEFVLQNDKGNGRVETAYLPSGYVPIGMTEFGGIIYIVSYNPLTDRSQVGCFPSPERNISTDELGTTEKTLSKADFIQDGSLKSMYVKLELMGDDVKIRPGDKFIISASNVTANGDILSDYEGSNSAYLKNRKIVRLHLAVVTDNGKLTYIEKNLDSWKDGYWVKDNSTVSPGGTVDIDAYRKLVDGYIYNVFSEKSSGKLVLVAELEAIQTFNTSVSPITSDDESSYKMLIKSNWDEDTEEPTVALEGIKYEISVDEEPTVAKWFQIPSKMAKDFAIIKFQNMYKDGGDRYKYFRYKITPFMSYGNLDYLQRSGVINLELLGTGEIQLSEWRYYINNNDMLISWGLDAYPREGEFIKTVTFKLAPYNITSEDDIIEYTCTSRNSYNGHFTEAIPFDQEFIRISNGKVLKKNMLYIVQIRAQVYSTDGTPIPANDKIVYRALYTASIFNRDYLNTTVLDFKDQFPTLELEMQTEVETSVASEPVRDISSYKTLNQSSDLNINNLYRMYSAVGQYTVTNGDVTFSEKFKEDYEFFDNIPTFTASIESASKGTIDNPEYKLVTTADYPDTDYTNSVAPKVAEGFNSKVKFELDAIVTDPSVISNQSKISKLSSAKFKLETVTFRELNATNQERKFKIGKGYKPYFDIYSAANNNIQNSFSIRLNPDFPDHPFYVGNTIAYMVGSNDGNNKGRYQGGVISNAPNGAGIRSEYSETMYSKKDGGGNGNPMDTGSGLYSNIMGLISSAFGNHPNAVWWRYFRGNKYRSWECVGIDSANSGFINWDWFGGAVEYISEGKIGGNLYSFDRYGGEQKDGGKRWRYNRFCSLLWKTDSDKYATLNAMMAMHNTNDRNNLDWYGYGQCEYGQVKNGPLKSLAEVIVTFASQIYVLKDLNITESRRLPDKLYYPNAYDTIYNYTLDCSKTMTSVPSVKSGFGPTQGINIITKYFNDTLEEDTISSNLTLKVRYENAEVSTGTTLKYKYNDAVAISPNFADRLEEYKKLSNMDNLDMTAAYIDGELQFINQIADDIYWHPRTEDDGIDALSDLSNIVIYDKSYRYSGGVLKETIDTTNKIPAQNLRDVFVYKNGELLIKTATIGSKASGAKLKCKDDEYNMDISNIYNVQLDRHAKYVNS